MIEIKNLSKQFEGFQAVENLSLRIETGEFFALLGPNGAGKTTTISMISTLLLPSGGEIYIDGERLTRQRKDIKRKVSVVTQEYSMRQDMNMDEIMEYQGRLYFMKRKDIRAADRAGDFAAGRADGRHGRAFSQTDVEFAASAQ